MSVRFGSKPESGQRPLRVGKGLAEESVGQAGRKEGRQASERMYECALALSYYPSLSADQRRGETHA